MATRARPERDSVEVVLDSAEFGPATKVGTLRFSRARNDLPVSFEYDPDWLDRAANFQLDPRSSTGSRREKQTGCSRRSARW